MKIRTGREEATGTESTTTQSSANGHNSLLNKHALTSQTLKQYKKE
jgi:hypothetical protein